MPSHVQAATPTQFLIREYFRSRGCFHWRWNDFIRLCAKLNETPEECCQRAGMRPSDLPQRKAADHFTDAEGILLWINQRAIDAMKTGVPPQDETLFPVRP